MPILWQFSTTLVQAVHQSIPWHSLSNCPFLVQPEFHQMQHHHTPLHVTVQGKKKIDHAEQNMVRAVKESSMLLVGNALSVVYYRFYNKNGAISSKQSTDPTNPAVGRINSDSVPPPHTAASMKRCLYKLEELDDRKGSQLFNDIKSKSPIGDRQYIAIRGSGRLGSTPENPMLFVASADSTFGERIRRIGHLLPFVGSTEQNVTSNREMRVITAYSQS
jgi:hypothetical protein